MVRHAKIMKKYIIGMFVAFLPAVAMAQNPLEDTILLFIGWANVLIALLMTLAIVAFFWGLVKYIANASDESAKESGKTLMIWGMIALFVMVAFWGIIGYFQNSLGLTGTVTTEATNTAYNPAEKFN